MNLVQVTLSADQKYIFIRQVIEKYNLKHMVTFLFETAGVSHTESYSRTHGKVLLTDITHLNYHAGQRA
jgi:hypothetical protein